MEFRVACVVEGHGDREAVPILVSSDDCPAQLGPQLLDRAARVRSDVPLSVILARREFEAWFLASAESLRGYKGLPPDLCPPADPEALQGAKEWLGDRMAEQKKYIETLDQPGLARRFDLDLARRADSFDKCYREVVRLLRLLRSTVEL